MNNIIKDWQASYLLRDLWAARHAILAKLEAGREWDGYILAEPDSELAYFRLECRERLVIGQGERGYIVAIHHFDQSAGKTALHDHRFPFAVWPFDAHGHLDDPLYDMPWERRHGAQTVEKGVVTADWGRPYAIEAHQQVFQAVHSRRPHYSLTLADDSQAPSRPERTRPSWVPYDQTDQIRTNAICGLLCVMEELDDESRAAR